MFQLVLFVYTADKNALIWLGDSTSTLNIIYLFPDETPKESNKRKLALLTAEHSQDRVDRVRHLTNTLACISHVVEVGQMNATNGYNLRDQMAQEFKTAATIVIVNSGGYLVSACKGGPRRWYN